MAYRWTALVWGWGELNPERMDGPVPEAVARRGAVSR